MFAQDAFGADSDVVLIEDAVAAAQHEASHGLIGETDARRPVVFVGMDKSALEPIAVGCKDKPATVCRSEIRKRILMIEQGRPELIADADIDRQILAGAPTILGEKVVA